MYFNLMRDGSICHLYLFSKETFQVFHFDTIRVKCVSIFHVFGVAACIDDVLDDYQKDKLSCKCPTACEEVLYTMSSSTTAWPSTEYRVSFITSYQYNDFIPNSHLR